MSREHVEFRDGLNTVRCRIDRLPLPGGRFFVWVAVHLDGRPPLPWHPSTPIDVIGPDMSRLPRGIMRQGRLIEAAPEPAIGGGSTTPPSAG